MEDGASAVRHDKVVRTPPCLAMNGNGRFHISIEGNIGVGKTTLMAALHKMFDDVTFVAEPVEEWRSVDLLGRFYRKEISALEFQLCAITTRFGPLVEAFNNRETRMVISERSFQTDRNVFAASTLSHEKDWAPYELVYDQLRRAKPMDVREVFILLDTPSVAYERERIERRGREEERSITTEYLQNLRDVQNEWFDSVDASEKHRIDSTQSPELVAAQVGEIVRDLMARSLESPTSVSASNAPDVTSPMWKVDSCAPLIKV